MAARIAFSTTYPDRMGELAGKPTRYGDMIVISSKVKINRYRYVFVKCDLCGTIRKAQRGTLKRGLGIKCGQACTQQLNDGSDKFNRMQRIYSGIQERTGNPKNSAYKYYGGKGVQNKFKTFPLFYLLNKDRYDEAVNKYGPNVELDRIDGDGHYSIENTRWVSHSKNMENVDYSYLRKPIIAISPKGEVFKCDSQSKFAEQHGLSRPGISSCLIGLQKTHCGWRFKYDKNK